MAAAHLGARADDALPPDGRVPFDDDAGIDHGVGTDGHGVLDVRAGGIDDGDAIIHEPVEDTPPLDGRHRGELLAIVDAQGLHGIAGGDGLDALPGAREDRDHVRQVVLALIVGRDGPSRGPATAGAPRSSTRWY